MKKYTIVLYNLSTVIVSNNPDALRLVLSKYLA